MFSREEIQRARQTHKALRKPLRCDCRRCYGWTDILRSYQFVKTHRRKYGQHNLGENAPVDFPLPGAAPSPSGDIPPPNSPSAIRWSSPAPMNRSPLAPLASPAISHSSETSAGVGFVDSVLVVGSTSGLGDTTIRLFDSSTLPKSPEKIDPVTQQPMPKPPPRTPIFTPGFLGLVTPRYLLSRLRPGTQFMFTPHPIPPATNIFFDLSPYRRKPGVDRGEWLYDLEMYPMSPLAQHIPSIPSSPRFLDVKEEQRYFADLLEEEDLPPPPHLEHNAQVQDYGDPNDAFYGIDVEPELEPKPEPENQIDPKAHADNAMDIDSDNEDEPEEPEDNDAGPGFQSPPDLRNFFIRTYLESAFNGATKKNIRNTLKSQHLFLCAQAERGGLRPKLEDELARFPLSLRALEHRLGLNLDGVLMIYTLCSLCGTLYTPDYIDNTENPNCTYVLRNGDVCATPLFIEVELYGKVRKRKPIKQLPYYPLHKALEMMLLRVGMYDSMQLWRGEGDDMDNGPPSTMCDWYNSTHEDSPLTGLHDGWGWRAQVLGMTCEFNNETGQYGDAVSDPPVALVRHRFGISFSICIDGFCAFKNGSYTVNGVYVMINNLPYYLRNRIKNILPVMITPGPDKPNTYQYDQMLQPLVNDLIELAKGIRMSVYQLELGRAECELVYGHLHSMNLDYVAWTKNCGHTSHSSEKNFCLYCRMRLSRISIPQGFEVDQYKLRNPARYLQGKFNWREKPNQRKRLYEQNGARWTIFDEVPGFYGNTSCPVDSMHAFSTGTTQWLINQLIVAPGMLGAQYARQPQDEQPAARFERGLSRIILPSFCSRVPPSLSKLTSVKSEQWFHLIPLLPVLLFDAFRDGRSIPNISVPRGSKKSKVYHNQQRMAGLLLAHRLCIHAQQGNMNTPKPTLDDCAASRLILPFYKNCLRYCVGLSIIHDNSVTLAQSQLGIDLLSRSASTFARMNYHLSPNWHIGTHVGLFLHKYGCARNFWCFACKRMHKVMINTHHNGHGLGTLETTMLRGYLKKTECIRMLRKMQSIPEPSADDKATTEAILQSMRTGPEREVFREMLDEVMAGEGDFEGHERYRLATNPAKVLDLRQVPQHWDLICQRINQQVEGFVVYTDGLRPQHRIHLPFKNSTVSHSNLVRSGIRFGIADHVRGNNSQFGFIHGNIPVIICRIYQTSLKFPNEEEPRKFVTVLVQRFKRHPFYPNPVFPWANWNEHTKIEPWAVDEYEELEAIGPEDLTGTCSIYFIDLPDGDYWLTVAMKPVAPEHLN